MLIAEKDRNVLEYGFISHERLHNVKIHSTVVLRKQCLLTSKFNAQKVTYKWKQIMYRRLLMLKSQTGIKAAT